MIEVLLAAVPVALLLTTLLAGAYPGIDLIERARGALAGRPPVRRASVRRAAPRSASCTRASGGRLVALSLGGRSPPGSAAFSQVPRACEALMSLRFRRNR